MDHTFPVVFVLEPSCCKFTEVRFGTDLKTGNMYVSGSVTTRDFDPQTNTTDWYTNAIRGTRPKYANCTLLYFIVSNFPDEAYSLRQKLQGIVANARLFCQPSVPGDSALNTGTHNQYALRVVRDQMNQ